MRQATVPHRQAQCNKVSSTGDEDKAEPCYAGCRSLCEASMAAMHLKMTGKRSAQSPLRMTLCGSEVPQDRWRGRTAGSGMWTRTENLLSWSPSGDSAIPYG